MSELALGLDDQRGLERSPSTASASVHPRISVWTQAEMGPGAFTFPDEPPGNRYYWLLVVHGDAEVCYSDPGGDTDLYIAARSMAFVEWHRGALLWHAALRERVRSP